MSATRRHFFPRTVPAEAGRRRVHRIVCSDCGTHHDISANTHCGSRATEDLLKVWRRGGWEIGNNPSHDLCGGCAAARRAARRKTSPETAEIIEMSNVHPIAPPVAEPPPEMTREDKRIIFAKLNEVYLDETRGYDTGWTDQRVANDLSIPRAWVERVRDENFGPVRDNEDIRALLTEWRALGAAVAEARGRATDLVAESAKVAAELRELSAKHDRLVKRVGDIEKSVAP